MEHNFRSDRLNGMRFIKYELKCSIVGPGRGLKNPLGASHCDKRQKKIGEKGGAMERGPLVYTHTETRTTVGH